MSEQIKSSSLHEMLDDYNKVAQTEVTDTCAITESLPLTMFVLQGRFGQGLALIENSLLDKESVARLRTVVDTKDNKIWLEIDTDTGVHVRADSLPLSVEFPQEVYVKVYDLCNAVRHLASSHETSAALWISDNTLYLGAFFNEDVGGFELEVGFEMCKPFEVIPVKDSNFDIKIAMDQITFNTVLDSVYNFETVEIHRKNGRVSYRTGDEHCTIATAMQNTVVVKENDEENTGDFSLSIPSKIFKTIPLVNAMDMDLSMNVLVEIDSKRKKLRIKGAFASLVYGYEDSKLLTYTNEGLEPVFRIKSDSISAAIGMYFEINHVNPTGKARIYGIDEGLIGIEGLEDERIRVNLTIGDCHVEKQGFEFTLPLDVFTMMIRNSACPELVMQHGFENGRTMMTYGNGMFLRKCTYNA